MIMAGEATATREETFHYPSLYQNYLGFVGKWLAILANILILYGLLIAYLTGATMIIVSLLNPSIPQWTVLLAFFAVISLLNIAPIKIIRKFNFLFVILMWASFAVIVYMSVERSDVSRLAYTDWHFLPSTVPILMTAFFFHSIIPHSCHALNWKSSTIWKTILFGMAIAYLMNAIWMWITIGALPLAGGEHTILGAFHQNLPSTVPLSEEIGSPFFTTNAMLFALLAIATSYLAFGVGLLGFFRDLTENILKVHSRALSIVLSFGPPLAVSILFPDIFLNAVNVVGGVGIAMLFGILPCVIGIKKARTRKWKVFSYVMMIFFAVFLIFEICQEVGLLKLKPQVESWTDYTTHK